MAKKRDRHWTGNDRRRAEGTFDEGSTAQPATMGMSFAGTEQTPDRGGIEGIEAWDDDQITAPDLFAEASDEDQMQASGGHTQPQGEDTEGTNSIPSRFRR